MTVMVWTVMSYKVEVWGWNEREKMEERYGRWVLGLETGKRWDI